MQTTITPAQSSRVQTDAYLQFQLEENTFALLLMAHIQEVFTLRSTAITAMPNLPEHVLGLLNRRSHISWMLDLARLLGFPPLSHNSRQYTVILIEVDNALLGLAVQSVKGVLRTATDQIQSPPTTADNAALIAYLRGYVIPKSGSPLLVLDAGALTRMPVLQDS